jgi:release factor glutamine methyltransferase
MEHGDGQGESAPAVFTASGLWREVTDHRDLAGRDRYLVAVRNRAGRVRQTDRS